MGVDDDPARSGLPEHLGQSHYGHSARADDVGQHLPGPTDGSWSISPTINSAALFGVAFSERLHQHDVDHRGLVDDEQSRIEGIVGVAFETAALWIDFQETVDRLGLDAVASVTRFAARPVGAQSDVGRLWRRGS